MIYDNFKINAKPFFSDVWCPKHKNVMVELEDGWFKKSWYCKECKSVYTLKLCKIPEKQIDKKALADILKRKRNKIAT